MQGFDSCIADSINKQLKKKDDLLVLWDDMMDIWCHSYDAARFMETQSMISHSANEATLKDTGKIDQ